ncbi:MAG: hypothetical protein NC912_03385 [Candidatus Omnitrophica bacterium]|nr:hypothetical protein [Candidatus Omnitrophota bacterium]
MKEDNSILILGDGGIAQAVFYYFKKLSFIKKIRIVSFHQPSLRFFKESSLIISCIPGKYGALGLEKALEFEKDLLDIADLDPPFYLKRKNKIKKAGITVIPGCGFCPGLINFIVGREIFIDEEIDGIKIKVGSFSKEKFYFPFLWCFEDLIQEHRLSSLQIISGKKIKLPAFAGYQKEEFLGIPLESYFSVSGFENILKKKKFQDFHFRVIRPEGFMIFFNFLKNYDFFNKENLKNTKTMLEAVRHDNYTFATIEFFKKDKKAISWEISSFSRAKQILNSMQKITAVIPVILARVLLLRRFNFGGLIFMEDLAKDNFIFNQILDFLKKEKIILKRRSE